MAVVSTKGAYGLEMLYLLAIHAKPLTLGTIAHEMDVSESYLEHIAAALKRAGYIKSQRGAQGGYALAWEMDDIIIYEVLSILESDFHLISKNMGALNFFWSTAEDKFRSLFSMTLSDIVASHSNQSMYYI